MATLFITEYANLGFTQGNVIAAGQEPSVAEQPVAIGGVSAASAAFQPSTRFVRLHCDVVCSVAFGLAPVAVTTAKRMAANQTEFFAVLSGFKVAVIANV